MARYRTWPALSLLTLLLLGRVAVSLAHANASWYAAYNDPTHFSINDLGGVVAKALTYVDSMEEVRDALQFLPYSDVHLIPSTERAIDNGPPGAKRPRAPPAA
jgi:hypothetical protein